MEENKVLIVEDEADTRYVLSLLLEKNNFEIKTAANGEEALKILQEFHPQVILADWNMPVMNGLELCSKIKNDKKLKMIYFVILTARSSLKDRVKGLDVGADDFLLKPIENQELLARLRSGIRIFNLQDQVKKIEHSKALIEMACTIGHRINNPLSSLLLSVKNLEAEIQNEKSNDIQEDFKIITDSIEKIKTLTKELIEIKDPKLKQYSQNKNMLDLKD